MRSAIYENLTQEIHFGTYEGGLINSHMVLSPPDPYGVFIKLAEIHRDEHFTFIEPLSEPRSVFHLADDWDEDRPKWKNTLGFTKWWYQEIPKQFWLYTNYINVNRDRLKESVQAQDSANIWIDTPGVKHKIKLAPISSHLREVMKRRELVLPDYASIATEVTGWGESAIHNYGRIKQQLVSWRKL
jgi:hypothetical protein